MVTTTNKINYSESSLPCSACHDDDGDCSIKANSTLNYLYTNKHSVNQTVKGNSRNGVTSTIVCEQLNDLCNEKNQLLCGITYFFNALSLFVFLLYVIVWCGLLICT